MAPEATTEPVHSLLPENVLDLAAKIDPSLRPTEELVTSLQDFCNAANYLAVAQIFLTWAPLDLNQLKKEHVKKRLLGHFGTCPGLNFVYAHASLLVKQTDSKILCVWGPGHGAPAVLSSLFLEGSITSTYGQYQMTKPGLDAFVKAFSWPGGFPSHINAETPGQIHEGGELGYALAVAYGAVMDKPDLISVCVVGDGEAETGPTATAWHAHKYLDPKESGAVLPILHVNGFKISERTLFGTMDDEEAVCLFTGYGYQVCFVEYDGMAKPTPESDRKVHSDMYAALRWAYGEIRTIQKAAREGKPVDKPRWPMIYMRTPKGWTGPQELDGNPIVNSFRSHQVPLTAARTDDKQFEMLKTWLASYEPAKYFNGPEANNVIKEAAVKILPTDISKRLGQLVEGNPPFEKLDLPKDWKKYAKKAGEEISPMRAIGSYLKDAFKMNPHRIRMFSPDELRSNKLDAVLDDGNRDFQWDPETAHKGGRVVEMLSEHTLQGLMQGWTLTGRVAVFPSYEAFLAIVDTMILQYAKFQKVAAEQPWRNVCPSLTYIETSTLWRQEHNGFSHQAPGLINTLLTLPGNLIRIYLPPDGNCAISCIDHCIGSAGYVNLIVGSKTPSANWLSPDEAEAHMRSGASVWRKYSTDEGKNPDIVLVGCGVETNTEIIQAAKILQEKAPELRIRVVNVVDLLVLDKMSSHPHAMDDVSFDAVFTPDKPVVFNFHGYPSAIRGLLFGRSNPNRFDVHGYLEQGTTTTPYSMLRFNKAGRWDLCEAAVRAVAKYDRTKIDVQAHDLITFFQHQNRAAEKHALEEGDDPKWFNSGGALFEQ